jgi:photosystem II stability/assembly factor-like uncharacterized protein
MKFKITGICIALLLLIAGSAFAQWNLEYKVQQNYSFNAVHFPSASVGYTVGSGGVIFKTSDGGSTWAQQTSPTTSTLYDVFFRDATNGFAVGVAGTIIYTTDGTNWSVHAQSGVLTTSALAAVWFVGLNGWVGGGAGGVACQIFSTSDGGTTWANNVVTNPSLDDCTELSFASATVGYASLDGNGLMYTTDGGINWTKSVLNLGPYPYTRTDLEAIYAINSTTAVAGPQPTIILVSTDGGATFNCPNTSYPWATYTYGYGFGLFGDGEVILVGGGTQAAGISLHGTGAGLTTWTRYPAFYGEAIQDVCVLPGTNKVVAVGDAGLIALSSDRGSTWTFAYDAGMPFQGLQDFVDLGMDNILAAGAGGSLLHFNLAAGTHDYWMASPNNWGPTTVGDLDYVVNPDSPGPGMARDSTFNDIIYLSGATKYLCKSYNGGKSWTELSHTNALADAYMSMYWFHPDTGFVVGHKAIGNNRDEVIWKTVDGGVTLTEVVGPSLPGTNMQWNSIDFAPTNRNIGVVVGDDNYIRYTTDGGVNWPLATENIATGTLDLEEVVMINPTTGFAVGDNGTLVKTIDGGANWLVQTVPWGTKNLLDIEFNTPNRLWVAGIDQLCYYSTDGGANWTNADVTPIVTTYDVMTVHFQGPAGVLWVGCHYSNVYSRTDAAVTGTDAPQLPFALNQNYPNPFNPSTTITFAIATDGRVGLNVYDVSGRLVATVMNENLKAGKHTVTFNADKLATGVYFYKLSTSSGEITRKMVIVR